MKQGGSPSTPSEGGSPLGRSPPPPGQDIGGCRAVRGCGAPLVIDRVTEGKGKRRRVESLYAM